MSDEVGGLHDRAWIELDGGLAVPAEKKIGIFGIFGAFRLVGEAHGNYPAFDTGWIPNSITHGGVYAILARFSSNAVGTTFSGWGQDGYVPADIADPPYELGLGLNEDAGEYYGTNELDTEITYGSYSRRAITSMVLTGPTMSQGKTATRKVIYAATVTTGIICAANDDEDIGEIGVFMQGGTMFAAAAFPVVTISGSQQFTAFYSIGLNQT